MNCCACVKLYLSIAVRLTGVFRRCQVSQNGLEIMGLLVKRMKADFRPYFNAVLPDAVDRLGT